jgi:hypothetical protein
MVTEQLKTNKELLMVYKVYAENHRIPLHEELKEKIDDMLHPRKSSSSGHVHTHDHGHGHSHDHGHSQEHSHDHGQKSEPSSSSEEQQVYFSQYI